MTHINNFIIAQKYARAFLNVFASIPSIELLDKYKALQLFLSENKQLFIRYTSSLPSKAIKCKILKMVAQNFELGPSGEKLLLVLLQNKKTHLLPSIITHILQEGRKRRNEFECTIESSHPLSEQAKESLIQSVSKKLGGSIMPTYKINQSLISGVCIRGKSFLWENSIAKRLKYSMAFIASAGIE